MAGHGMRLPALLLALWAAAGGAAAQAVAFDGGWREQGFRLLGANSYGLRGTALDVASDGTVSLVWRALPAAAADRRQAAWRWRVERSVPATDLTRKGGDDRNLALYFLFLPEAQAGAARDAGIGRLLRNPDARVLVYTWGGAHARGEMLASPYLGARGRTVVLRPAGTGSATERVDLARDHARAFGSPPGALVGLAVSADSDDTDSAVRARIEDLRLD